MSRKERSHVLITGVTVIDATGSAPKPGHSILVRDGKIDAIGPDAQTSAHREVRVVDAHGKYAIPGLLNANVHLLCDVRLENLVRYETRFEDLIVEAAQVALKNGLTTVFDTWGPRRFLLNARERIERGDAPGARIYCAGNIVGFDGPFSEDFFPRAVEVASAALTKRVNAIWVENVGRHLMWLPPNRVAEEMRAYIGRGIHFVKYASNEHGAQAGAFLQFSPAVQEAIVAEAHRAGITAQAHTTSVEGLRLAIEAGCDLIQHANITGPEFIPSETLELLARSRCGAVIFPLTERGMRWLAENVTARSWTMWKASDENARRLLDSGARLLLANDGNILAPEAMSDPAYAKSWAGLEPRDSLSALATGHFVWLRAMEEKGMSAIALLQAATRNIAECYGLGGEIGTLEAGKKADIVLLDSDPLASADNYQSIHCIFKDGVEVNREALPQPPILTAPIAEPVEEEARYVTFLSQKEKFPLFPTCSCH